MRLYPPGPVTRAGAQKLLERIEPLVIYISQDKGIQWGLAGGLEPTLGVQEGAALADGVQGLFPSFKHIESKGARQHGVTWQHTVYEPAEYDMQIEFTVPPNHSSPEQAASAIRRVIRHWHDSWNPEIPGMLIYITPDMGKWYCTPRLLKAPPEREMRAQARRLRQKYTWTIRNDDAFWKGTDSVSTFRFTYSLSRDTFTRDDAGTLGAQWQQTYTGAGAGVCETDGTRAVWTPSGTGTREVRNRLLGINEIQTVFINGVFSGGTWTYTVNGQTTTGIAYNASAATVQTALEALSNIAPGDVTVTGANGGPWTVVFKVALGFQNVASSASGAGLTPSGTATSVSVAAAVEGSGPNTTTNNQVITVRLGEAYQYPFPASAAIDIWGRWNANDASPTAVRARIKASSITLSRFNAGVETVMFTQSLALAPVWWEDWSLVCGVGTTTRRFKVLRNGFEAQSLDGKPFTYNEVGTGSSLGSGFRGSGFGMLIGAGTPQNVPPSVDEFNVGDNSTVTQTGHLTLTNIGDQDGYARYLVYGPGTFKIANGPSSADMIKFGPLADNQIALLTTLPRLRGVVDLSAAQPEQELNQFQEFLLKLVSLATNNNVPPLLEWFESLLGIRPPQGEMYSLLTGRFTNPIPQGTTGTAPSPASIAVEVSGGNADSKIVAALTPLRRWPE